MVFSVTVSATVVVFQLSYGYNFSVVVSVLVYHLQLVIFSESKHAQFFVESQIRNINTLTALAYENAL